MAADITIVDIEWYPSDPAPGETVEFRVQVRNDGTTTAESVGVVVKVDGEYSHVPPNFDLDPDEQRWTIQTGYNSFDAGVHEGVATVEGHDTEEFTLSVGGELGAVQGRVTIESGGEPVGSRVYLSGNDIDLRDTRTDADGEFRFEDLPPGSYTVEFEDTKYEGFGQKQVSVDGGETAYVSGEVEAQTYDLEIRGDPISPYFRGDDSGEYLYNEEIVVTAPSEYDGYEFKEWRSPDGTTVWEDEEYTFTLRSDRTIIAQYSEPGDPDLTVEGIEFSPSDPTEEDTVEFTVEIRNKGESAARNFDLEVTTGDGYISRSTNLNLDAGDSGELQRVGEWNPSAGTHTVEAEINYNRNVEEESYRNNVEREDLTVDEVEPDPTADLAVMDLRGSPQSPTEGDEVEVSGYIENHGALDVSNVRIDLSVDGETQATTYRSIDGNDRKPITFGEFTVGAGLQTVKVEIDPYGEIDETTDSNNVATTSITADDKIETYDVTFVTRGNGEIRADPPDVRVTDGSETYEAGESVTIEPVNVGDEYQFERWEGDIPAGRRDRSEITLTIEEDRRVTAVFTEEFEASVDGTIDHIDPIGGVYEPGDEVRTEVVVENTGNVEHTFFVEYSVLDESGTAHPSDERLGRRVTVQKDAVEDVTVEWKVDENAPTGEYDVEVILWRESSADALSSDLARVSDEDVFRVDAEPDSKPRLSFESFEVDPNPVSPNEPSTLEAELSNAGPAEATEVTVTIDVEDREVHSDTVSIEAEDSEIVQTELPEFDEPQTVPVSGRTSKDDSEYEGSVYEAEASTDLVVEVTGEDSLEIEGLSVSPDSTSPDSEVTIAFELRNESDEVLPLSVTGRLSASEADFETEVYEETVELESQETMPVERDVELNSDVPSGEYDFEVSAVRESDESSLGSTTEPQALEVTSDEPRRVTVEVAAFDAEFNELSSPSFSMRQTDGDVERRTQITSGGVSIPDVPEGLYEFEAESERRDQQITGLMHVTEDVDLYRVQFPLLRSLSGVLVGADGYPIADAEVSVNSQDIAETVRTNSMGMFSFGSQFPRERLMMDVAAEEWSQTIESSDYFDDHHTIQADAVNERMKDVDEAIEWRDDPVTYEDILLSENRASVNVLTKFDQFRRLADTITTTIAHGVAHGIATSILDTVEGLGGLVAGIIEFIFSIPEILNNLFEYLEGIWNTIKNIIPILGYILAALPKILDQFVDSMEADNPYDSEGDEFERIRHLQFAVGWYIGYASLFVLSWYIRAAAASGTILNSSRLLGKAKRYSRDALSLSDEAQQASETATSIYRRSKNSEILEGPPENMAVASGLWDAMTPASTLGLDAVQPVVRKLIEGSYIISHRAVGKEWLRIAKNEDDDRTLNLDDETSDDVWSPSGFTELRKPYQDDYDKDPSDLVGGDIGNLKGGVGEAVAIREIVFGDYDEFDGIGMDSLYGSYYAGDLTDGTSSVITTIGLTAQNRDNVLDRLLKDGYDKGEVIRSLEGVNSVDGELDLVRVKETPEGTVVERIYETKSGSSVDLEDQVSKKIDTLDVIRQLDDHPGVDSTKVVEEWGISLRAFTRAERNDIETVGGTGEPDVKLITASDTEIRNSDVLEESDIDSEVLRLSHSSSQIEKAAEYLFSDDYVDRDMVDAVRNRRDDILTREQARNEIVEERKGNFDFLFDPDYKVKGGGR